VAIVVEGAARFGAEYIVFSFSYLSRSFNYRFRTPFAKKFPSFFLKKISAFDRTVKVPTFFD